MDDSSSTEPLLDPSLSHRADGKNAAGGHFRIQDGRYSYAYGPQGYAGLLSNSYALGCAVFASIGGLTFGA
jgi:hypothetical protein